MKEKIKNAVPTIIAFVVLGCLISGGLFYFKEIVDENKRILINYGRSNNFSENRIDRDSYNSTTVSFYGNEPTVHRETFPSRHGIEFTCVNYYQPSGWSEKQKQRVETKYFVAD